MQPKVKKTWQQVDGVLLLDKSSGMTSNEALQKARRLFSAAKGGHTGTLDPMATGLLPLCFGEATKFAADLLEADKTYEAVLKLGVTTDSGDAEGQVIATSADIPEKRQVIESLPRFIGELSQIPPMHSALKRNGRPLYELARQGIEVVREPRLVRIYSIDCLEISGDMVSLRVKCSKGTYIRVLAADIGTMLGCGAHLVALRRIVIGKLLLDRALTLAQLEAMPEISRQQTLQPVDALLQSLPRLDLDAEEAKRFSHGNPVSLMPEMSGKIRVYAAGRLIGVGEPGQDSKLWPRRLVQLADSVV